MTFLEFRNQLFDLICFNICQVYASQYEWDYVPSFQSPWSTGGVITYYYEMNWGCDGDFNGRSLDNIERSLEDKDKNKEYPLKSVTLKVTYNEQYHYPEKVIYSTDHYVKKNAYITPGLGSSFELNITEFVP